MLFPRRSEPGFRVSGAPARIRLGGQVLHRPPRTSTPAHPPRLPLPPPRSSAPCCPGMNVSMFLQQLRSCFSSARRRSSRRLSNRHRDQPQTGCCRLGSSAAAFRPRGSLFPCFLRLSRSSFLSWFPCPPCFLCFLRRSLFPRPLHYSHCRAHAPRRCCRVRANPGNSSSFPSVSVVVVHFTMQIYIDSRKLCLQPSPMHRTVLRELRARTTLLFNLNDLLSLLYSLAFACRAT
mmetsp:Transcript_20230/g.51054  ORF Transcript_20230/g.51054 Transcript_20230/m.51054 type:complete len:234 (-) Transcript_20230:103-804(-)